MKAIVFLSYLVLLALPFAAAANAKVLENEDGRSPYEADAGFGE